MVSVADPCGLVWNSKQHIDLTFVQVADRNMGRSLELHRTKLRRPAKILRAALADEPSQRMDSRQALIARGDRTAALLFEMSQEGPNYVGVDVGHKKLVSLLVQPAGREHDQKTQRIPIALLRIAREVALVGQMLHQEAPDPGAESMFIAHRHLRMHSARSGDWPLPEAPASSSDNAASSATRHARDRSREQAVGLAHRRRCDTTL